MTNDRVVGMIGFLLVGVLACNLQGGAAGGADLAATVTAQALAIDARAGAGLTPANTGLPGSGPGLSVSSATECLSGPNQSYDLVFTAAPGQSFKLVGRNTASSSWIIADPTGGTCWIRGANVVVSADTSLLPEYPVPPQPTAGATRTPKPTQTPAPSPTVTIAPSPTPAGPNYPDNLQIQKTCTSTTVSSRPFWIEDIKFTWRDNAYNETGYYILHGNPPELLMTLDANVTQFLYQISYDKASTLYTPYDQFFVQAFNDVGVSLTPGTILDRCN
jgi:hypothetical protein